MVKDRKKCTVFPVHREIIESKLLLALEDEATVAIVATVHDLDELVAALETCRASSPRVVSMLADLKELRHAAFGPPTGESIQEHTDEP